MDRPVERTNPDGTCQKNAYDDTKNIAYTTDENHNRAGYFFDGLGKLVQVKEEQQRITLVSLKYDDQYNVIRETDPNGNYKGERQGDGSFVLKKTGERFYYLDANILSGIRKTREEDKGTVLLSDANTTFGIINKR